MAFRLRLLSSSAALSGVLLAVAAVPSGAACGGKTSSCVDVEITAADRACSTDADCAAIPPGMTCAHSPVCACTNAPVNQTALDAFRRAEDGAGIDPCDCPLIGQRPACIGGECQLVAVPDAGPDASPDGGGVQVVASSPVQIDGATDGGQIIYETPPGGSVWAVPFTGGTPTEISPPGFSTPGAASYTGGAVVSHHVVVMSMVSQAVGESSATAGTPVSAWDERTGVTTTFTPPPQTYGNVSSTLVSADSQYIAIEWQGSTESGNAWSVSRVDGTDSLLFGPAYSAVFDQDWLVYSTTESNIVGAPAGSLVALDGANGWASVTLATSAASYAVDAIGARVLFASGASPDGGAQGVVLAPLDGGAATVLDPTGGGPVLYLSPDSTFAMYTAAAGTGSAQVEALTLPTSGPPGTPYAVSASALSLPALYVYAPEPFAAAPGAPGGPVGFFALNTATALGSSVAIVGVGAGATVPNVDTGPGPYTVPFSDMDGFTGDQSRVLITRPNMAPAVEGSLTVFPLPGGPESAPLSTSSYGWTALGGTVVLFTDGYVNGAADLRIADVATGSSSALVASAATSYAVSPDRTLLAYTPATTGDLWVTPLPGVP